MLCSLSSAASGSLCPPYPPIFNLNKYQSVLFEKSTKSKQQIVSHIDAIKKQEVTQIFYLPLINGVLEESIVFLDRVLNLPNLSYDRSELKTNRLFTLSDYGSYLFILKLSIHFTRIQDKIERKNTV